MSTKSETFRLPIEVVSKIEELVKSGKYGSKTFVVEKALKQFFELKEEEKPLTIEKPPFEFPSDLIFIIETEAKAKNLSKEQWLRQAIDHYLTCSLPEETPSLKPIIVKYEGHCKKCNRILPIGIRAFWAKGILVCFPCYLKENVLSEQLMKEICDRLLIINNEPYCLDKEGKHRKLISIKACEVCKEITLKERALSPKPQTEEKTYLKKYWGKEGQKSCSNCAYFKIEERKDGKRSLYCLKNQVLGTPCYLYAERSET